MHSTDDRTPTDERSADWGRARDLVMAHGWNAVAYQILNPGIRHWFSKAGDAVIGYAVHRHTIVVAGGPVCEEERLADVVSEFSAYARARHWRVLYFGAGSRLELLFSTARRGARVHLGAQPWWNPATWDDRIRAHKSLRAQLNRARNKGVRVDEWPASRATNNPELQHVLRRWLSTRGLPPLHFLVEPETLALLDDRRVFVALRTVADRVDAEVVAFLIATPIPARNGWLLEQWPRRRDAPNGTVELLVDSAMRALQQTGSDSITMGLAPLSPRAAELDPASMPMWLRALLTWARAHGRRFYDFDGLERFKAKFDPAEWEPIHAIVDDTTFRPLDLIAIAGVFSRGSPFALSARALAMAAQREIHALGAHLTRTQ